MCLGGSLVWCGLSKDFSLVLYCLIIDSMWLDAVLSWLSLPAVVFSATCGFL